MIPLPTHDSRRARLERALTRTGWCLRCGRPWKAHAKRYEGFSGGVHHYRQLKRLAWWGLVGVTEHSTYYTDDEDGSEHGCFPLCEGCWRTLTAIERMPYYAALVDSWIEDSPDLAREYMCRWRHIRTAVRNWG